MDLKQKIQIKKDNINVLKATIENVRANKSEYKNPQRVLLTLRSEITRYSKEIRELKQLKK